MTARRGWIVVDKKGRAYRHLPEAHTHGRLFSVQGRKSHSDMRGVREAATLFPSLAAARTAVGREYSARRVLWNQDVATDWYHDITLLPVEITA